jgi:membrane fusion protein (multidrug efflux system)
MIRFSLLLLLLWGCSEAGRSPAPTTESQAAPPRVEVTPVVEQRLDTTVQLQGELSAYESVALHSRVQGYVEEVLVDRGSVVKKGETLVRLSAPEMIANRTEAESQVQADSSTLESLKGAATTPGAVAKHDIEIAEAKLAASRSRVEALRDLENYLIVRAPFDGIIAERNVHPGAFVGPPTGGGGIPLLRIEQVSRLRLTVAVPEADVGAVAPGLKAQFVVSTWPGERFTGTIARVAHLIDPKTRTMPVELDVPNADSRLAAGMFAEVLWPIRRASASLWIPATALVQTADRSYVDRVRNGAVEIVPLRRGVAMGKLLEIFGPIEKGDLVLVRGSEELRDGARVDAQPAQGGP